MRFWLKITVGVTKNMTKDDTRPPKNTCFWCCCGITFFNLIQKFANKNTTEGGAQFIVIIYII